MQGGSHSENDTNENKSFTNGEKKTKEKSKQKSNKLQTKTNEIKHGESSIKKLKIENDRKHVSSVMNKKVNRKALKIQGKETELKKATRLKIKPVNKGNKTHLQKIMEVESSESDDDEEDDDFENVKRIAFVHLEK